MERLLYSPRFKSQSFNLIRYICWMKLNGGLRKSNRKSQNESKESLIEVWHGIELPTLKVLVVSVPSRLNDVLSNNKGIQQNINYDRKNVCSIMYLNILLLGWSG